MNKLLLFITTFLCQNVFAQPNFVFILSDDMGWNGTSQQISPAISGSMSDYYETPNIEQMAMEGMTFSHAYAPAAKCSPTRASILTGQTTARNSFTETGNGVVPNNVLIAPLTNTSINSANITLAEWLKGTGQNYRTAHYGKWHLGNGGTASHGFDFGDGNTNNNTGNAGNGLVAQTDPKSIFDMTTKGIDFMQTAVTDGVPFYLQLSHYAVHAAIEAKQGTIDYFNAKTPGVLHSNPDFAAMTKDWDEGVGLILDEITNLGIAGNTYVIFMSDHGSSSGMSNNSPLRRGKSFIYEGGIRVPMIIKGPNVPANSICSEPVIGYDLFPTIAALTGSSSTLPTLDGQNITPLLLQNAFTRNEPLYFHIPHYTGNPNKLIRSAAIEGNYKLIVEYDTGINYLYDLSTDIAEATNIAAANPSIVNDLLIHLRDHFKTVNANMPTLDPTHANFSGTAPDIDSDGLDDAWEFTELLAYTYGASDDPDGDGLTNLQEFSGNSDPLIFDMPLAIEEIKDLEASRTAENEIYLRWQMEGKNSIESFEIQRSNDASNWENIGAVGNQINQLLDKNPLQELAYYRIKGNYLDGRVKYSSIVQVQIINDKIIELYPNPAKELLYIRSRSFEDEAGLVQIGIYNQKGYLVQQIEEEKRELITVLLNSLETGIYTLRMYDEGNLKGFGQFVVVQE